MPDKKKLSAAVRVDVKDLMRCLAFASAVLERRTTIPITSTVLLTRKGKKLTVVGTDLDIEATATCDTEGGGSFSTCIDPRRLRAFCDGASGMIEMGEDKADDMVWFKVDGCTLRLRPLPAEDFPRSPTLDGAEEITVGQDILIKALRALTPCMSTEQVRYYLNGLFLTKAPDTGRLRFVATDGRRMGIYDFDTPGPEKTGILPSKAVKMLSRAIRKGGNEPVRVEWTGMRAAFHTPSGVIRSKMIDGTYPDYTGLVPKPSGNLRALVNATVLKRAMSVSGELTRALQFDPIAQAITCNSTNAGSATVPCQVHGDKAWGFNGKYILDMCLSAAGPVQVKGSWPGDPFLVTSDDPSAIWVLMSMRV